MLDTVDTPLEEEAPRRPSITLGTEMQNSFLNYAVSVVRSRAVPDVRDGLKPVHRRIIYTMETGDYHAGKQHKKSARVVGDVMGKLHPHGDQAIYDAMVRLGQPWNMRSPLIDGQGNFGSMDGDPPAAMRYTEARMSRLAHELTRDIEKDTVDFRPNYDGREMEPVVLPARFPNVLINGQVGIAVGMATNIPPHNLGEVSDALLTMLDKPDLTLDEVLKIMPGPDFPTHGVILGKSGIRESFATGRGSITMSGVWSIEKLKGNREAIVVTQLPFLVNKEQFIVKIKDLVEHDKEDQRLNGVSNLRDESDSKDAVRVVIELKRDADPNVIINRLKRDTELIKKWHYNATCLDSTGKPREMPLLDILSEFIAFRRDVVRRRTEFDLNKARDELHKQVALYAATSRIDDVIRTIRNSEDADDARGKLMAMRFPTAGDFAQLLREADPDTEPGADFQLDTDQANAILALALRTLTGLEREKIANRARELSREINGYLEILNDPLVLDAVVRREFEEIKAKYAEPRLTVIEETEHDQVMDESLIERKDIVVNLTARGYVKRTEVAAFREQRRGGAGKSGMDTKEDDYVVSSFVCTTKTPLVFFTNRGIAFALKAWHLPDMGANNRGRALANFINLRPDERVTAVVTLPEDKTELENLNLVFVTNYGTVRRNAATDFATVNKSGKIAMQIDAAGDGKLIAVLPLSPEDNVLIATAKGQIVRFPADKVRLVASRNGDGVRAIDLAKGDVVISASTLKNFEVTPAEREMYAGGGSAKFVERNTETGEVTETVDRLSDERLAAMQNADQLILTVCANGYGKTVSSHEYRITDRGGKGVAAGTMFEVTGPVVACFPVEATDGLILVTDAGQTIRTRVSDIRQVQNRLTKGVRLFNVPDGQKIVAASRLPTSSDKE
ncbi:DNA gyrase subunit A [Bradyrhizobium sp. USDA 4341]